MTSVLAVSFWCQAQRTPFTWTPQFYVGVWLVLIALAVPYGLAMRHRARTVGLDQRDKRAMLWYALGLVALWAASDWPLGTLGAAYLFSVHTVLYIIYTMVAAPLLLLGIPDWMARRMVDRLHAWGVLRFFTTPWVAAIVLNIVLVVTHLPPVVDFGRSTQIFSFVFDALWLFSGVVGWLPVISPFRGDRVRSPIWRCVYLFVAFGAFPMLPGAFITFAPLPMYSTYELAPRLGDWTALDDQQLAGALMKVGNIPILWTVIAVTFIKTALGQIRDDGAYGYVLEPEPEPAPSGTGPAHPVPPSS